MLLFRCVALAALLGAASGARATEGRPNVVWISLDTTRADALSCYGEVPGLLRSRGVVTPRLDALAAEGARFERAYAHAPTTLSSHATLFTGLDPHQHAIPRNGFPLADGVPTFAARLAGAGWDTIAVIGAAALAPDMGLATGFRVYDASGLADVGTMYQDRADGVLARALAAVDGREADGPLFLFAHFFDPHQPFDPPSAWRARFADPDYTGPYADDASGLGPLRAALREGVAAPADVDHVAAMYLAEVAYTDDAVGRLLDALAARGLLDHAIVVVVADHGETLSETPSYGWTHGNDVSDGVMRVPLIVRGYGVPLAERAVIRRQVGIAGLAPTLEEALGLPPILGRHASFLELLTPGPARDDDGWPHRPTRPVVMEATRPHDAEGPGWNNRGLWRGIRAGGAVLHAAPRYDVSPRVVEGDAALGALLGALLEAWDAAAPPFRSDGMTPATREALRALGYLSDDP